jgi:hypothetical protein
MPIQEYALQIQQPFIPYMGKMFPVKKMGLVFFNKIFTYTIFRIFTKIPASIKNALSGNHQGFIRGLPNCFLKASCGWAKKIGAPGSNLNIVFYFFL